MKREDLVKELGKSGTQTSVEFDVNGKEVSRRVHINMKSALSLALSLWDEKEKWKAWAKELEDYLKKLGFNKEWDNPLDPQPPEKKR